MEYLLGLLIFPVVWPFIAKAIWKHDFTWQELGINIGVVCVLVAIVYSMGYMSQTLDVEILNGEVTGKSSERVSCSHSYSCNCRESCSGSGQNRSCSTTCDTCYEHSYDIDWDVSTTVGSFTIDRLDHQGLMQPPRWAKVMNHDPVAKSHIYTNYIKGAPDTLFNKQEYKNNQLLSRVPSYPNSVYDYQYVDRVIPVGVSIPNIQEWNMTLARSLNTRGALKQVNYIILMTNLDQDEFVNAIKYSWLGGKKNDVIVIIGSKGYPTIDWVDVVSWSVKNVFHEELKDALEGQTLDPIRTIEIINHQVDKNFSRVHMKDFVYLRDDVQPPTWVIILAALVAVFGSIGMSFYFMTRHDHSFMRRWRYGLKSKTYR